MTKRTYIAEFEGCTFKRGTQRVYTHAIVGQPDKANDIACILYHKDENPEWFAACMKKIEDKEAAGHYQTWEAIRWCGRPDLAQKELNAKQWGYTNLHIVEVRES